MIECVDAIRTAHGGESGGRETRVEDDGSGFANPLEIRLPGSVIEGEDEENAIFAGGGGVRRSRLRERMNDTNYGNDQGEARVATKLLNGSAK